LTDWQPREEPFLEFTRGFYVEGSVEVEEISSAVREVLPFALALSDSWSIRLWTEMGWLAGRKVGTERPELLRRLIEELSPEVLRQQVSWYRDSVLGTTTPDGVVQPVRATLHYFGWATNDRYARSLCRGDQPRYLARAAFDFAFWMAMLGTQPIPAGSGKGSAP
jgi:hypothetical protein